MTTSSDPSIRRSRSYIAGGSGLALLGIASLASGSPMAYGVAALGGVLGGLFVNAGIELRRTATAMPAYRELLATISRGQLDEAEKRIETIARSPEGGEQLVTRVLTVMRTTIAMARGDFEKAAIAAGESLDLPLRPQRTWDDVLHLEARSHRALANAVRGHAIAEDVDVISDAPNAVSAFLARVAVAQAIVLAKAEQKTELGEHLTRQAALILGHANGRERALYRALRAWTRASSGVYREPPPPNAQGPMRAWIERVVPAAAFFAPNELPSTHVPTPPAADRAKAEAVIAARIGAVRAQPRPRSRWTSYVIAVVGVFASLFLGGLDAVGLILIGLLLVMLVAYIRVASQRGQTAILEAERNIALGRIPIARSSLRRVADAGSSLGASAGLHLAGLANREGDFSRAIAEVEAALGLCKEPAVLDATRFFVIPGLLAESAVAFAGLDRFAESEKELTALREGFAEYAHLDAAVFRVQLVSAMRRGDEEAASAIASRRTPHLALDFSTELLADLALGDRSFEAELGSSPMTAAWLQKVAPH